MLSSCLFQGEHRVSGVRPVYDPNLSSMQKTRVGENSLQDRAVRKVIFILTCLGTRGGTNVGHNVAQNGKSWPVSRRSMTFRGPLEGGVRFIKCRSIAQISPPSRKG